MVGSLKFSADMMPDRKCDFESSRPLDDLRDRRKLLTQSEISKSRDIGLQLEMLQDARQQGGISAHSLFLVEATKLAEHISDEKVNIPDRDYDRACTDLVSQCTSFRDQLADIKMESRLSNAASMALMTYSAVRTLATEAVRSGASVEEAVARTIAALQLTPESVQPVNTKGLPSPG